MLKLVFLDALAILTARLGRIALRLLGSSGGTWPGELARRISPMILSRFLSQDITVVFIAGTNGKTTTAKMLQTILTPSFGKINLNDTGANLENGLIATFVGDSSLSGKLRSKFFILEVDEAALPKVLSRLDSQPRSRVVVALLNLFRDQLDRYGEIDLIARKWSQAIKKIPASVSFVVNADDSHLVFLAQSISGPVKFFGLNNSSLFQDEMEHATDSVFCPRCACRLSYQGSYFSHLGRWSCFECHLKQPQLDVDSTSVASPLGGKYNVYNVLASTLIAEILGVKRDEAKSRLLAFKPAFGRFESLSYNGRSIKLLLSKNPTGFNESLKTFLAAGVPKKILLLLNDRIPDGRDVSWIWDVDFELLAGFSGEVVISGDRAYDLAVRLKYANFPAAKIRIVDNLPESIKFAVGSTEKNEELWVLATYSAMLEARKTITGKAIL